MRFGELTLSNIWVSGMKTKLNPALLLVLIVIFIGAIQLKEGPAAGNILYVVISAICAFFIKRTIAADTWSAVFDWYAHRKWLLLTTCAMVLLQLIYIATSFLEGHLGFWGAIGAFLFAVLFLEAFLIAGEVLASYLSRILGGK